jgi:hypothetical protein
MIEIYRQTYNGKNAVVAQFDTYIELFRGRRESDFVAFGCTCEDRTTSGLCFHDATDWWENNPLYGKPRYCYVAYDNNQFVSPDRLVGMYRNFRSILRHKWFYSYEAKRDRGMRAQVWGRYRKIHSTQERRWAHAWDDETNAPICRGRRTAANLPNSWDDYYAFCQKNWKSQRKTKHQWKNS